MRDRFRTRWLLPAVVACTAPGSLAAHASDLHLQLTGNGAFSRKQVMFACDGQATALGLPAKAFPVEYINGAGNSLALISLGGRTLIFTSVASGSGARYAADKYTWSDGGPRGAFLSADVAGEHPQTLCREVH